VSASSPAAGSGDAAAHPTDDAQLLARSWWVTAVAGVLNLIAALIVLVAPHSSLVAIALVLGIYLLLVGLMVSGAGLSVAPRRWPVVALGALAIVAGIFVILRPGSAVHGVRIVFAIYLLVAAIAHLGLSSVRSPDRGYDFLRGVLELAGGIIFLAAPSIGLAALALIVGLYLVLRGVVELVVAFALREARPG
jgi:uncharacterized membrane protein HdeD (DUF308 family)